MAHHGCPHSPQVPDLSPVPRPRGDGIAPGGGSWAAPTPSFVPQVHKGSRIASRVWCPMPLAVAVSHCSPRRARACLAPPSGLCWPLHRTPAPPGHRRTRGEEAAPPAILQAVLMGEAGPDRGRRGNNSSGGFIFASAARFNTLGAPRVMGVGTTAYVSVGVQRIMEKRGQEGPPEIIEFITIESRRSGVGGTSIDHRVHSHRVMENGAGRDFQRSHLVQPRLRRDQSCPNHPTRRIIEKWGQKSSSLIPLYTAPPPVWSSPHGGLCDPNTVLFPPP